MTTGTETASVTGCLQADHRRLDGLMAACARQVRAGDPTAASASFAEFRRGLMRHIKIEEGLLFPEFELASGLARASGPTGVMRLEHAEIIRLVDLLRDVLDAARPSEAAFESLRSALTALLHEHNVKEERILYPMTDRLLPAERLADLLSRMRAL